MKKTIKLGPRSRQPLAFEQTSLLIQAQSAAFTLRSDNIRPLNVFLERHGLNSASKRFVIPATVVPRVRDQLDLVGIDERHLFPDLDGVAAETCRYLGSIPSNRRFLLRADS